MLPYSTSILPFVCVTAVTASPTETDFLTDGKGVRVTLIIPFSSDTEETYCPTSSVSALFNLFIALVIAF